MRWGDFLILLSSTLSVLVEGFSMILGLNLFSLFLAKMFMICIQTFTLQDLHRAPQESPPAAALYNAAAPPPAGGTLDEPALIHRL